MLLQRLKEYADHRMDMPPTLYTETPVRYIIELDANGRVLNPQPTDTADPANPKTKRGQRRMMPQIQRTVGIKPLLLADKADYTLELGGEGAKPERVKQCHAAYLDLVKCCAEQTHAPEVIAVLRFLEEAPGKQLALPDNFDTGALITFRVNDTFVVDLPAVQAFWATMNTPASEATNVMQCIVCGQERPVLETLQAKVKGVPGGQMAGTSIISANAKAFESYGLERSLIAPTCADCGERFTKAINELLSDQSSRVIIGGAAFICWTRKPVDFDFISCLTISDSKQLITLMNTLFNAKPMPEVDEVAFYATVLSGSGARVVVRDWIDTTVGEVKGNLATWFQRQQIADEYGEAPRPFTLYQLAGATVRELKDLPTTTPRALLRAALTDTPLPMSMLYQAVRRNRAEQKVTRQRAALIKLVLLSRRGTSQENIMVELDLQNTNVAYRCGRLLAVLAEVQRNAIGKAAVVDRFYGTASSAPAAVFGRLLRGAQPHLTKLERDRPGVANALQRRLEDVMSTLHGFPTTLTLEEQALFALGFYHQRAYDRAQMIAASERKKAAGQQASSDETQNADSY